MAILGHAFPQRALCRKTSRSRPTPRQKQVFQPTPNKHLMTFNVLPHWPRQFIGHQGLSSKASRGNANRTGHALPQSTSGHQVLSNANLAGHALPQRKPRSAAKLAVCVPRRGGFSANIQRNVYDLSCASPLAAPVFWSSSFEFERQLWKCNHISHAPPQCSLRKHKACS